MLQKARTIGCLAIIVCLFCPQILAETGYDRIEAQLEVYNMYVLNNSDFWLICQLKRGPQKINYREIECALLLPDNISLISQSGLDQNGRINFKIHVSSTEANTKLGIFINDKQNNETYGYWTKFNKTISLSSIDRTIANVSPVLTIMGGSAMIVYLFAQGLSPWGKISPDLSVVSLGAFASFLLGATGTIYTNRIIRNHKTSFEQLEGTKEGQIAITSMDPEELTYYKKLILGGQ